MARGLMVVLAFAAAAAQAQETTKAVEGSQRAVLPESEQAALYGRISSWWDEQAKAGKIIEGHKLQGPETATTVRVEDGRTLTTDGPFVDMKEALGGYLFYEADDLDAAIELAARIPAARLGGAIEVRPIVEWQRS